PDARPPGALTERRDLAPLVPWAQTSHPIAPQREYPLIPGSPGRVEDLARFARGAAARDPPAPGWWITAQQLCNRSRSADGSVGERQAKQIVRVLQAPGRVPGKQTA